MKTKTIQINLSKKDLSLLKKANFFYHDYLKMIENCELVIKELIILKEMNEE